MILSLVWNNGQQNKFRYFWIVNHNWTCHCLWKWYFNIHFICKSIYGSVWKWSDGLQMILFSLKWNNGQQHKVLKLSRQWVLSWVISQWWINLNPLSVIILSSFFTSLLFFFYFKALYVACCSAWKKLNNADMHKHSTNCITQVQVQSERELKKLRQKLLSVYSNKLEINFKILENFCTIYLAFVKLSGLMETRN